MKKEDLKEEFQTGEVITGDKMSSLIDEVYLGQEEVDTINKELQTSIRLIEDEVNSHKSNLNNPHGVTAEQVGAYTKAETDTKLGNKADKTDVGLADVLTNERVDLSYNKSIKINKPLKDYKVLLFTVEFTKGNITKNHLQKTLVVINPTPGTSITQYHAIPIYNGNVTIKTTTYFDINYFSYYGWTDTHTSPFSESGSLSIISIVGIK